MEIIINILYWSSVSYLQDWRSSSIHCIDPQCLTYRTGDHHQYIVLILSVLLARLEIIINILYWSSVSYLQDWRSSSMHCIDPQCLTYRIEDHHQYIVLILGVLLIGLEIIINTFYWSSVSYLQYWRSSSIQCIDPQCLTYRTGDHHQYILLILSLLLTGLEIITNTMYWSSCLTYRTGDHHQYIVLILSVLLTGLEIIINTLYWSSVSYLQDWRFWAMK